MQKQNLPKYMLCFDSETSGTDFSQNPHLNYQAISWGLVIFDTLTFDIIDTIYVEVKFNNKKYKWSTDAEKIHGLTQEYLQENGVTEEKAAEEILNFLLKYFDLDQAISVLGHNVWFDVKFLHGLLDQFGLMIKINQKYFDTSSVGTLMLGISRSDDLFSFLGLPERAAHNSLEDALMTVAAMQNLKILVNHSLNS